MDKKYFKYSFMDFLKDKSGYFSTKSVQIPHVKGIAIMLIIGAYLYITEFEGYPFSYYIIFMVLVIITMYLSRLNKLLKKSQSR